MQQVKGPWSDIPSIKQASQAVSDPWRHKTALPCWQRLPGFSFGLCGLPSHGLARASVHAGLRRLHTMRRLAHHCQRNACWANAVRCGCSCPPTAWTCSTRSS